jgi:hypothetical protein
VACLQHLVKAKGFNANTTMKGTTGKPHSLSFWAINLQKPDHLKVLLEAGADPNAIDENGLPIALEAMESNDLACLKVLLEHGLKPWREFKDEKGHSYSLAQWAFNNGYNEAHDMFINHWPAPQANQQQTAAAPADQKKSAETTHKMEE